ncbi:Syo1p Ecym_3271 [Eremothecium cymbalariae DBVPG|uniref:SYO1-like TPR repeats domain-containing protein n=1 Tax=Eremothecium cymbalariae (strain CBS 270.75 / DBVPG 7215 / KCTC 17166 / NRRL Y-17582) TaxID=931890 RepID=G8JRJ5_ERECY|nr:Hypothetical protein Ecym_3271 [Eremothecium cymbalariae DBVPG\
MGKSKKRLRSSRSRSNPLGRNVEKEEQVRRKKIQPLLEKLQSVVANDRSMALGSISVLCEDPYMRELFLKEKLIQLVMNRLITDENTEIMVESFGLLRNLCLEGYDVATHLWRLDIWTGINAGFDKLLKSLDSMGENSKATKESKRLLFDFGDNLLSLVVALANGSDNIFNTVTSGVKLARLLQILSEVLRYGVSVQEVTTSATLKITTQLFNTVLDLLYTFSAESAAFIETIKEHNILAEFVNALPSLVIVNANELTKVLVQGILLQFLDMDISYVQASAVIQNTCSAIEHINLEEMKANLNLFTQDEEMTKLSNTEEISKQIRDYTKRRSDAMMKLQSLELSLDVITAVIELVAAKFEEGDKNVSENLVTIFTTSLPVVFQALFKDFGSRVLIAWNNLLWLFITVGINLFELPNKPWHNLWASMNELENDDLGNRLGKLSCMWALLKSVQLQNNSSQYLQLLQCNNVGFAQSIIDQFNLVENLDYEEQLDLKQRCLSVLSALAMFPHQVDVNKLVGQFFIQLLSKKDLPPRLLIDVLNHFIDIYSDAEFDYDRPVFVELNYLESLRQQVMPNLKTAFKFIDKNKDPQLKNESREAFTTLDSFIHYKVKERS